MGLPSGFQVDPVLAGQFFQGVGDALVSPPAQLFDKGIQRVQMFLLFQAYRFFILFEHVDVGGSGHLFVEDLPGGEVHVEGGEPVRFLGKNKILCEDTVDLPVQLEAGSLDKELFLTPIVVYSGGAQGTIMSFESALDDLLFGIDVEVFRVFLRVEVIQRDFIGANLYYFVPKHEMRKLGPGVEKQESRRIVGDCGGQSVFHVEQRAELFGEVLEVVCLESSMVVQRSEGLVALAVVKEQGKVQFGTGTGDILNRR